MADVGVFVGSEGFDDYGDSSDGGVLGETITDVKVFVFGKLFHDIRDRTKGRVVS